MINLVKGKTEISLSPPSDVQPQQSLPLLERIGSAVPCGYLFQHAATRFFSMQVDKTATRHQFAAVRFDTGHSTL